MTYKITALVDVSILVNIRTQRKLDLGGQHAWVPAERLEWLRLKKGEETSLLTRLIVAPPPNFAFVLCVVFASNEHSESVFHVFHEIKDDRFIDFSVRV
jgi:hypothetical protein